MVLLSSVTGSRVKFKTRKRITITTKWIERKKSNWQITPYKMRNMYGEDAEITE